MIVCIAGKNEIAVHGMNLAINKLGKENVIVCTNKTDSGVSNWQPSLYRHANALSVKVVNIEECYEINDLVFISLEFDKIIRPDRFISNRLYNIHFSKLPSYKGVYTSAWPILNGETESAATLHCIDYGIDTGEIIDQRIFEIAKNETARTLYFKYQEAAKEVLNDNFDKILNNTYISTPQSPINSSYYGINSIDYKNLAINTRNTAESIGRQIRAFSFREYQLPIINGFAIGGYQITSARSKSPAGTLSSLSKSTILLSTIDYDMVLHKDNCEELFFAIDKNDTPTVINLVRNGVDTNVINKNGWVPLMIYAFRGDLEICKILIENGANPNARNMNGTTVLMYAKDACVRIEDFELCKFLVNSGANPLQADFFGKTVLHYAKQDKQVAAVKFFEEFI